MMPKERKKEKKYLRKFALGCGTFIILAPRNKNNCLNPVEQVSLKKQM